MIMWYIILAVWLIGIFVAYFCVINKWEKPTWEKVWLSVFWPLLIPLYIIHVIRKALM